MPIFFNNFRPRPFTLLTHHQMLRPRTPFRHLSILLLLFVFASCANYKIHPRDEASRLSSTEPAPKLALKHSVFLIGDAGDATATTSNTALQTLEQHLQKAGPNSSVIFLGDNIYPVGLPPKSKREKRAAAEAHLDAQLGVLDNFAGQPIFIPGNHDWYKYGVKGLDRQERYLEKRLNRGIEDEDDEEWGNYFLPDQACSGPAVVKVNDQLVIIVIDSQWWLSNWDKVPNINEGCESLTRAAFAQAFKDAVRKNKDKNIVVALHHPLYSNGIHGGKTTVKDHLFPLESLVNGLYLPLPGLGSIAQGLRATLGSRQDISNSFYRQMREDLLDPAETHGEFIFVSGHEHNLQYFQKRGQHFVVSGAGSKKSATSGGNDVSFAYGHEGFSKIDFYEDGSAWLEFWIPSPASPEGKRVFRQAIKGALPNPDDNIPSNFPEYEETALTISKPPITTEVKPAGKLQTFLLGKHYRDIYLNQYDFPKLDLEKYQGGVEILTRGGGMQTNSLRMLNPDGQQYIMRSLTKDESRGIPQPFKGVSFVAFLFRDNYLATQPFAPMAIPTLARAGNVYYAKSEIYYIPKQPRLEGYNLDFGGEVYITEERAAKDWRDLPSFGNSPKIISTPDVSRKIQKNDKHFIDQNWVARSRLFDLIIGDWDRHSDQWRWSSNELDSGKKRYRPIPRDRDQAFSKYDGWVIKALRPWSNFLKQLPDYTAETNKMKWAFYNGRHFDNYFLNELPLAEWEKEAAYLRDNLGDEVIDEAFTLMPPKVQELSAESMKSVLRARRDKVVDLAREMYEVLAVRIPIVGTEKRDYFEVIRKDDEHTEIAVYPVSKKGKRKDTPSYRRTVKTSETKEVYLYGLGEDDEFYLSGTVDKGIVVHVIGGLGEDVITDESKVTGWGKKTKVHDSKGGIAMELGGEGQDRTSRISRRNSFDRMSNIYDASVSLTFPILSVNPNDGFLFGFQTQRKVMSFNKAPYGQLHQFSADFATATSGLRAAYRGEFIEATGNWDFVIKLDARSSRNTFNYFGFGNETPRLTDDRDFNRVQQSSVTLDLGWQKRFSSDFGRFSIRPVISVTDIKEVADRFVTSETSDLVPDDFETKFYGGIFSELDFKNIENPSNPKRGIHFQARLGWQGDLEASERNFVRFNTSLTLYTSFDRKERLTFATRVGTAMIDGSYEFWQAPTIGRRDNLRGFFPERFRGERNFFHTSDLRWELFNSQNVILPFSMGLIGSFDHGRLWVDGDPSDVWHTSYGGGLWIAPLDFIVLSFGYHISDDDELFLFNAGHAF